MGLCWTFVALTCLGLCVTGQHTTATSAAHRIHALPGYSSPTDFDQFAGHLSLPSSNHSNQLFYWLVEKSSNATANQRDTSPLVLWLNGGPGCSSLTGLFTELGPFVVQPDLTLLRNPYAWNRHMNILFVESPLGVGFSAPRVSSSADYNDKFTAARLTEFLVEFIQAYPWYAGRDLYVTGESYAGMYIPHLVEQLLDHQRRHVTTNDNQDDDFVQLKGFAIGNPITDHVIDNTAFLEYYYTHGMISIEAYTQVRQACNSTALLAQYSGIWATYNLSKHPCAEAVNAAMTEADTTHLNRYDIYADVCVESQLSTAPHQRHPVRRPSAHRGATGGPCVDKYTQAYLGQRSVQVAIHVLSDNSDTFPWRSCQDDITDDLYQRTMSVLPLYPKLLEHQQQLRVLIYSGDADSMVNFMGTQRWISTRDGLGLTVTNKWKAWFGPDKQLAGYTQAYDKGLTYSTVKGAGHMVPATRPLHALYMIECFVFGLEACQRLTYPVDSLEYLTGDTATFVSDDEDDEATPTRSLVQWWHFVTWYGVILVATVCCMAGIKRKAVASQPRYAALNNAGMGKHPQYDSATS
ncbi:hypothetical protein DYB25_004266 [Aphanomyces astaci]|uniref:Carboxypeptidase n=2 Tax=Aphanomyces astaci TaxID=112090 RepID=A0A397B9X3_APHAT|nr:hypothetical protein DYB25_004266 [Aphanomyces astaci]